jgi:peroxiredoxin (alkyl hydroperoxide reductase subunit C)
MPKELKIGCQIPKEEKKIVEESTKEEISVKKEEVNMLKVGKPVPNFTAPAYQQGKFINVDLSEYKGKWVLLCFYPGDFTFV